MYPGQVFDNSRFMEDGFTTIPGECNDVRTYSLNAAYLGEGYGVPGSDMVYPDQMLDHF